jgi:hypothetical protein
MDWMKKLGEYAPHIVSAIASGGATLPSLAMKAVGDAFGEDITDEGKLSAVIDAATPDQLLKLKSVDNNFKLEMQRLSNELEFGEIADTQHAREQHKTSRMPAILCCALTIMVGCIVVALFNIEIPAKNEGTLYIVVGQILTLWGGSVAYWVGTTRSSHDKTKLLGKDK